MEKVQEREETKESVDIRKKRFIGRGIYGSKDVPIKILDSVIIGIVVMAVLLTLVFSADGGYEVRFETDGGTKIESQKVRYGKLVEKPETPIKAGYELVGWVTSQDEYLAETWDFSKNEVEEEITLYAVWKAASVNVILDANGGAFWDGSVEQKIEVTFGECYGEMEIPVKDGFVFDGWEYSGNILDENSVVNTNGEHILKARWEKAHE